MLLASLPPTPTMRFRPPSMAEIRPNVDIPAKPGHRHVSAGSRSTSPPPPATRSAASLSDLRHATSPEPEVVCRPKSAAREMAELRKQNRSKIL